MEKITRAMETVAALMSSGVTDSSLVCHLENAKAHGVTRREIAAIVTHLGFYIGWPRAWAVFRLAKDVWKEEEPEQTEKDRYQSTIFFPVGEPNGGFAQYFTGRSYLAPVSEGQILICVGGRGYYQEWDKDPVEMRPGDCVNIPEGVKHWHGAAPDSWFSHLAVEVPGENSSNEWLEPVDDTQYGGLE